jgi:hypothetical protein
VEKAEEGTDRRCEQYRPWGKFDFIVLGALEVERL